MALRRADELARTRRRRTAHRAVGRLLPLALCALLATPVAAQEEPSAPPPDEAEADTEEAPAASESEDAVAAWFLEAALQARVNPLGLTLVGTGGYRIPLYAKSHLLLDGSHIDLGATVQLSPAYLWAGPVVVVSPLSILVLRASYQRLQYFGTFGYVYQYGDLDADWSPDREAEVDDAGLGQAAGGNFVEVSATLQVLVSGVAAVVTSKYDWFWTDVEAAYVEPYFDLLLEPSDAVWTTTAIAGYLYDDALLMAGLWEHTRSREGEFTRDVVGPLVIWELPASFWRWGAPQLAVLVGYYVRDTYRENEVQFALELSLRF